jgi:TonB-linked SusC/RagA family outer membrane protein
MLYSGQSVRRSHTGTRASFIGRLMMVAALIGLSFSTENLMAQVRTITGKVTQAAGANQALNGVKVTAKGTNRGAFSRQDGSYSIVIPSDAKTLVFEYVGYKKKEVPVGSTDEMNVQLAEDVLQLEELVVTAVGIKQERKAISYATQEVKGDVIQQSRSTNIVNALSGQIAGVTITSSSGVPGASSFIRIRGVSSITGNNQPLFVVDGIPINNDAGSLATSANNTGGTDFANRALDLNPDDIESVNVLKGAAATSLYGLLASAGAVVITTKRGQEGVSTKVNYSFNISLDNVNKLPPLQTQYAQGLNGVYNGPETGRSQSWGPNMDTLVWNGDKTYPWDPNGAIVGRTGAPAGSIPVRRYDPYTFFTQGITQQHNLNISSGSNNAQYFASLSHLDSKGVVPNSTQLRTTLRLNADYRMFSDFTVSGNIQYARTSANRIERGSNVSGVTLGLFRTPPTFDNSGGVSNPVTNNASYIFPASAALGTRVLGGLQRTYRGTGIYDNPFWVVNNNPLTDNVDRLIGSVELKYSKSDWFLKDILGDLGITLRAGNDWTSTKQNQYFAVNSASFPNGRVTAYEDRTNILNADLLLTLNKSFSEDFRMNLLVAGNIYQRYDNYVQVIGNGITIPEFYHISNTQSQNVVQYDGRLRRSSVYGRLGFDYKGAVYANVTVRNDQSTSLPVQNNSFTYGGVDAGVILTELLGLTDSDVLSYAKVRGSYATVGSDAPIYALTTPWFRPVGFSDGWTGNVGISFPFRGQNSFLLGGTIGSPDLRPESRREFEVGGEIKLFKGAIGLDVTYYQTTNIDQILNVPIARSTGFNTRFVNIGRMENSGFEVVLSGTPIRAEKPDDFQLDFTVNLSTFQNKVVKLADGVPNVFLGGFTGGSVRAVEGLPYGSIFGLPWLRDSTKAGNPFIIDQFGRPQPGGAELAFGSAIPNWTLGFRPQISFAGFTVAALLDIRQGGVVWNGTRAALNFFGTSAESQNRDNLNGTIGGVTFVNNVAQGVTATGQTNTTPIGTGLIPASASRGQAFYGASGFYNNFNGSLIEPVIEDASWVRLREVTVSYRFPKVVTDALLIVRSLELFATGRNLWLSTKYTGIDPETNLAGAVNGQGIDYFNFPNTSTYTFGVKVGF